MKDGECFFHLCAHASYKDGVALYCSKAQSAILKIYRCPLGYWEKDRAGMPVNMAVNDG